MHNLKEALILKLSALLVGKHTNSETVSEGLRLLVKSFSFQCGAVYDIDQCNCLHIKEQCFLEEGSGGKIPLVTDIPIEALSTKNRMRLANADMITIQSSDSAADLDLELLVLFSVRSMTITGLVDDRNRLFGLIVLMNRQKDFLLESESNMSQLVCGMGMLSRYVGIRLYQHKLSFAQTSLKRILDNTGIDIYVNDFVTHDILYVNRSMAAPYGGVEAFIGKKCWEVLFPGQRGPCEFCPQKMIIDNNGEPTKVYTWDYQRPFDGSWFRVFSAAFRWVDGRLAHVVSSADITDNKRNEELIQYMANYDPLTNLPNRRMLIEDCKERIDKGNKADKGYVLFFDIDGFKAINDRLGHDAGDEFLVKLGSFFSEIPLLKKSIYRNGGDEFVAIIEGNISDDNIINLARFLHTRFAKPWVLKNGTVFCNTSIGVACYPEDGETAEELLSKADQAMYKIKKLGGGSILFARDL